VQKNFVASILNGFLLNYCKRQSFMNILYLFSSTRVARSFESDDTFTRATWTLNKENISREQLNPLRSRSVETVPNAISKKQYLCDAHIVGDSVHTRRARAAAAVEEQSIAPRIFVDVCGKKVIGLSTAHFPRLSARDRKKN